MGGFRRQEMKKAAFAIFALALVVATSPAARADSFNFTFSDGGVSGSGVLTGVSEAPGVWLLTGGSGSFNDGVSSGVITLQPNPNYPSSSLDTYNAFGYDNQLMLWNGPNQYLDANGLFFTFGALDLNIYQSGGGPGNDGWYTSDSDFNTNGDQNGSFAITSYSIDSGATPEPGSILLLGTGIFALAGLALRRRLTPGALLEY
jgi:hypothetical protein